MTWYRDDYTMYAYALLDDDGLAVYVGITCNPTQRRRVHMITASQPYRGDTPLKRWLLDRKRRGLVLDMLVLEKIEGVRAARVREVYWIDLFLRLGRPLLNTVAMPKQNGLF